LSSIGQTFQPHRFTLSQGWVSAMSTLLSSSGGFLRELFQDGGH
jgi:hypothetical protein